MNLHIITHPNSKIETIQPYDYFLGFSTNSLIVIGRDDLDVKEIIVNGEDKNITLIGFEDQSLFLDSINMIKGYIDEGKDPLKEMGFIQIDFSKIFEFLESLERG